MQNGEAGVTIAEVDAIKQKSENSIGFLLGEHDYLYLSEVLIMLGQARVILLYFHISSRVCH